MQTISEFINNPKFDETITFNCANYRKKFTQIIDNKALDGRLITDKKAIEQLMQTFSWNWSAFFFNVFWAIYRKEKSGWYFLLILLLMVFTPLLLQRNVNLPITIFFFLFFCGVATLYGLKGNSLMLRNYLKIAATQTTWLKAERQYSFSHLAATPIFIIASFFTYNGLLKAIWILLAYIAMSQVNR